VRRTNRYRLYPTRRQVEALGTQLAFCCDLYNAAPEQRRDAWRLHREGRSHTGFALALVRRMHEAIANVRRDHAHKVASGLVSRFGVVYVEHLNIKGLAGSMLAKHVHDQGWGRFLSILSAKAEEAGCSVVKVSPRNTSQVCSGCGALVAKDLRCRVHRCPDCELVLDRENAARNILAVGPAGAVRRQREARGLCVA